MTATRARTPRGAGIIARWAEHLDVDDDTPRLTIGEGGTPLVHARAPRRALGVELHLKLELANPTGSFKDRGMCVAVARAVQAGAHTLICASTGNTSASAAAFAAAAGLRCVVVVPSGKIAAGKLLQAQVAGALVVQIDGSFDDGLDAVRELGRPPGHRARQQREPVPHRGAEDRARRRSARTSAARTRLALHPGRQRRQHHGVLARVPRVARARARSTGSRGCSGVQAAGAAPLVDGAPVDAPRDDRDGDPHRPARARRPGARGDRRSRAARSSSAPTRSCSRRTRARRARAGIFCEPASAISVAGLMSRARGRHDRARERASSCVLTGHGLKDPDSCSHDRHPADPNRCDGRRHRPRHRRLIAARHASQCAGSRPCPWGRDSPSRPGP